MASRYTYVIVRIRNAAHVCRAVFSILGDDIETVRIDAYSDYERQMPADIRKAETWLRDRGLLGTERDPAAAISIGRDDDIGWEIGRAYALWSTRVALLDGRGAVVASLDDGSRAVTLSLDAQQAASLADAIRPARLERLVETDPGAPADRG
jgi:hypothetical protein